MYRSYKLLPIKIGFWTTLRFLSTITELPGKRLKNGMQHSPYHWLVGRSKFNIILRISHTECHEPATYFSATSGIIL